MPTPQQTRFLETDPRPPSRSVQIFAKDFTQGEEGIPLPVIYGRVRRSGIHVTPIFGFRSTPIYSQMGK